MNKSDQELRDAFLAVAYSAIGTQKLMDQGIYTTEDAQRHLNEEIDKQIKTFKAHTDEMIKEAEKRRIQSISDKLVKLGIPVLDYDTDYTPIGAYLKDEYEKLNATNTPQKGEE